DRKRLLQNYWIQLARLAFHHHLERRLSPGCRFIRHAPEGRRQIAQQYRCRAQVPHAISALSHHIIRVIQRFLDFQPHLLIASLRDGMELQDQPLHALQQRVVQIARDSFPLFQPPFHAVPHLLRRLPQPHLVRRPEQSKKTGRTQENKPARLVVRRSNREIKRRSRLVPHAAVVARYHAESVFLRRQIAIKRLPPVSHVLPIAVPAFQFVAETHLLRRHQAQRRVVNLQIAQQRRQFFINT